MYDIILNVFFYVENNYVLSIPLLQCLCVGADHIDAENGSWSEGGGHVKILNYISIVIIWFESAFIWSR